MIAETGSTSTAIRSSAAPESSCEDVVCRPARRHRRAPGAPSCQDGLREYRVGREEEDVRNLVRHDTAGDELPTTMAAPSRIAGVRVQQRAPGRQPQQAGDRRVARRPAWPEREAVAPRRPISTPTKAMTPPVPAITEQHALAGREIERRLRARRRPGTRTVPRPSRWCCAIGAAAVIANRRRA